MTAWAVSASLVAALLFMLYLKSKKNAKLVQEKEDLKVDCESLKIQLKAAHDDLDRILDAYEELKDVEKRKTEKLEQLSTDLPEKGDSQGRLDLLNGPASE